MLKILRAIAPEVIFEERRPSESQRSLEAVAIAKYGECESFQRVAVDRYDMPGSLFAETQRVFDCLEQTSEEYLALRKETDDRAHRYGFDYPNNAAFETTMARISETEEKVISATGDRELIRGLERWRQFIQNRNVGMVGNIYKYCRENVFYTGVFLVGAAHKTGIVKLIGEYASTEAAELIGWKSYDGETP